MDQPRGPSSHVCHLSWSGRNSAHHPGRSPHGVPSFSSLFHVLLVQTGQRVRPDSRKEEMDRHLDEKSCMYIVGWENLTGARFFADNPHLRPLRPRISSSTAGKACFVLLRIQISEQRLAHSKCSIMYLMGDHFLYPLLFQTGVSGAPFETPATSITLIVSQVPRGGSGKTQRLLKDPPDSEDCRLLAGNGPQQPTSLPVRVALPRGYKGLPA